MKKKITFTASYIFEVDDEWLAADGDTFDTFEAVRDNDYDNVDRPMTRLEDCGWVIEKTDIEDII